MISVISGKDLLSLVPHNPYQAATSHWESVRSSVTKTANPLTYGFRAVLRDPAILLAEVVWRWCFGAVAFFLLFGSAMLVMSSVTLGVNDTLAWRSRDPYLVAESLLRLYDAVGGKALKVAGVVLPVITLLWTILGSAGRTFTLSRLAKREVRFRTILALHGWRAFLLWLAVAALVAAIAFDSAISSRGSGQPDLFLYYALAIWSLLLIGGLWATINWCLSLAAVCCAQSGAGAIKSFRQAVRLSRTHGGDFGGVSLMFAVLRLIAIAVAFVLCALPSGLAAGVPNIYTGWVVAVSLVYFAVADFLYISRFAAYLIIDTPVLSIQSTGIEPSLPAAPTAVGAAAPSSKSRNGVF